MKQGILCVWGGTVVVLQLMMDVTYAKDLACQNIVFPEITAIGTC